MTPLNIDPATIDSVKLKLVLEDLNQKRYFKLICGGSFSDLEKLKLLINIYSKTAVSAIDVGASLPVVEAAVEALKEVNNPPLLMVSFPLESDPHFRKAELTEERCINCGSCISVCPTEAFYMANNNYLRLNSPLCYGCGRCIPLCPVEALRLDYFTLQEELISVLKKPQVEAVEIHTSYADCEILKALYNEVGSCLKEKLISVCLRPETLPADKVLEFLAFLRGKTQYPLIIQVDGIPMSGSDDPRASIPALEAAREFAPFLPENCYLTISGGINSFTAEYLKKAEYSSICGVGMGTFARQKVWDYLSTPDEAIRIADSLVRSFWIRRKQAIIKID